jgi:hypothetical protein
MPDVWTVTGVSGKGTLKNFKAMLAEAKPSERSIAVCLRGDLVADHDEVSRELARAEKSAVDSLAGNGSVELAEKIQALEAQMLENSLDFRIRGLPRAKFHALIAEHPPRRDPETKEIIDRDRFTMVNFDTFFDTLLKQCTVEPELDEDDWLNLLGHNAVEREQLEAEGRADQIVEGVLSQPQWDKLTDAAWFVNGKDVDIPLSHAASRMKRDSVAE